MINNRIKIVILFSLITKITFCKNDVDLIVFSFDRAMQLYAFLESTEKFVKGINKIFIIYRSSNEFHENSYKEIKNRFNTLNINMIKQGANPKLDFKPLLLNVFERSKSKGLMFAVDDIIVTDYVDLDDCISRVSATKNTYGFYLRNGKNIKHSYPNIITSLPAFETISNDVLKWTFFHSSDVWRYTNTLDMAVYCRLDIVEDISSLNFSSPNTLESVWGSKCQKLSKIGLCYNHSKIINIPANLVQKDWHNINMSSFSTDELLQKFQHGYKIDISKFFRIKNNCTHHQEIYTFIRR